MLFKSILITIFFFPFGAFGCVDFTVEYIWKNSERVYIGKPISGKLIEKKGYKYAQYFVDVEKNLKGKNSKKEKIYTDPQFLPISIGKSFIFFDAGSGFIDHCSPTQIFEEYWLSESEVVEDHLPKELISKVKMLSIN